MAIDRTNLAATSPRVFREDFDAFGPWDGAAGSETYPGFPGKHRRFPGPLVSILINNYNYAQFVGAAIDSALRQTYPDIEVIVVDDGSTDGSRDIIARYGRRIIPVFKRNGGQGSAFNAGVARSRGEILCFLDADDFFYPDKVSHVVQAFREQGLDSKPIMMHHLLTVTDDKGENLKEPPKGETHASPMNRYAFALRHRFVWYEAGPTTTISINRTLANRLFPIPEQAVRISGDDFVVCGASLIGEVYSIGKNLGGYRIHGNNNWHYSDQRKSPEFINALETYLNAKLTENGKSPVISFNDSIYAWPILTAERRWAKLGWHMLRIAVKDHDRYTFIFMYHRVVEIGMMIMARLRRKRRDILRYFVGRQSAL